MYEITNNIITKKQSHGQLQDLDFGFQVFNRFKRSISLKAIHTDLKQSVKVMNHENNKANNPSNNIFEGFNINF